MKKTIYLFTIILFFSAMSWAQPQSATAIVNSQKIMAKTKIGLAVQKKLMQLNKEKQATFIQKQNEIKALEKEALSPALNAETREKKSRLLEDKKIALKRLADDFKREMNKKTQKALENLQKQILPVLQQVAKTKGFKLVHDITGSGIAFFDPSIDISDAVIEAVDKKFPK